MSLDSIIKLNISKNTINIAQAGFGVPLIVGVHNIWPERVRVYDSVEAMQADGFLQESSLLQIVQVMLKQKPAIKCFKIGRREGADLSKDLAAIYEEDADFYGLLLDSQSRVDILAAAEWAERHRVIFGADLTDLTLLQDFKDKGFSRTFLMYHPDGKAFTAAALMSRMLQEDAGTSSWAFKSLAGVKPYALSAQQAADLDKGNANRYICIKDIGLTLQGKALSGEYLDVIAGIDWLHVRLQERLFALLMKNKKIPYTNKGVDLVRCEIMAQLNQAVSAGILAAEPAPVVSAPNVADIDPQDKEKRVLPNVNFTATLSGAIHSLTINGTVSL